jgi:acyl carrier protein
MDPSPSDLCLEKEMRNMSASLPTDPATAGAAGRLAAVFADVFKLPREHVRGDLQPGDVPRWDSIGHMTLVLAIEEEFAIQCEVDEVMEFTSFQAILSTIERRLKPAFSNEVSAQEKAAG